MNPKKLKRPSSFCGGTEQAAWPKSTWQVRNWEPLGIRCPEVLWQMAPTQPNAKVDHFRSGDVLDVL